MAAEPGRGATGNPAAPPQPSTSVEAPRSGSWWGDVPDNIVVRISAFLRRRADRVHMASVNRAWNAAVRGLRRPPPPVLPPLPPLPPHLPRHVFPSTEEPVFYSATSGSYYLLHGLPDDVRGARICGSGGAGWLVLALDERHNYALYSLNSGRRIPLPPSFTTDEKRNFPVPLVVRVATFSAPPSPNYRYMVASIVLVGTRSTAAFWIEGREHWTGPRPTTMSSRRHLLPLTARPQDVIYHENAFFFVTSHEDVISFSPTYGWDGKVSLARVDYDMEPRADYGLDSGFVNGVGELRRYLVESRGRLLMVVRFVYDEGYIYDERGTKMIRVFKFRIVAPAANVLERPRAAWENFGELDGRMLFLGAGCSRSFEVAHYDGFEESTIYFLDDAMTSVSSADGTRFYSFTDTGRYSVEEVTTEPWPPGHPTRSDIGPPTWWFP